MAGDAPSGLRGEAAIDTSYVTGVEITSTPAR